MAKTIKAPASVKVSWRVSSSAAGHVTSLSQRTGWSEARCATFLLECAARVMWSTAHSGRVTLRSLQESRGLVELAARRRTIELHAESAVKLARGNEAAARKKLVGGGVS